MNEVAYHELALQYLDRFCKVIPNRRTGSPGNGKAIRNLGFEVDDTPFPCLDYELESVELSSNNQSFDVYVSPYSMGCSLEAALVAVSSIDELEQIECQGKALLMRGDLCSEQLMPKNFVFYNPEHHQKIYQLLELKAPAAIITATTKNTELAGALDPYPLINDGDFDIPSVYCTEAVGEQIHRQLGELVRMVIESRRIPTEANNIIAKINPDASQRITFTAHIDTYENTPGATDNASGIVTLLLIAQMLRDYNGPVGIEIAAFNGEDHYSAAGQMDYLKRYGHTLDEILVAVNLDLLGFIEGRSAYTFYDCPNEIAQKTHLAFRKYPGIVQGEPWYNGDHMIFVQNSVPAIAFASELMPEITATITHTPMDEPDQVEPGKLIEVAQALVDLVHHL